MKKFILFFVIILFFSPYLKSQNCEDCERTTVYDTKTIVLCTFNSGMQLRPRYIPPLPNGVQEYDLEVITGPCVFVIVDYAIVRCWGLSSIWIKDAVYVDNREYWRNIDSYKPMNSCPYPNIYACSPGSIRSEIMKAIAEVISLSGLAGNPINNLSSG